MVSKAPSYFMFENKNVMRKKNDKFYNRMHGMRTIYAHEIIVKIGQQNELTKFLAFQLLYVRDT